MANVLTNKATKEHFDFLLTCNTEALTLAEDAKGHLASGLAVPFGFPWSAAFSLFMASFTVSGAERK